MRSLRLMTALLAGTLAATPAIAATDAVTGSQTPQARSPDVAKPAVAASNVPVSPQTQQANADNANLPVAQALLQKSSAVIKRMQGDPNLKTLMTQAKGILVMPDFGHVAFIIGGRWSSGVLVTDNKGQWSVPAFFAIGGGSLGGQAATSNGPVAVLIMSQRVMDKFSASARWSLNSTSGFNVVNYSAATAQSLPGKNADAIVWTGISGNPAQLQVSINNIGFDSAYSHAVYGTMYLPAIFASKTPASSQLASDFRSELPAPADAPAPMTTIAVATGSPGVTGAGQTTPAPKPASTATTAPKPPTIPPQSRAG